MGGRVGGWVGGRWGREGVCVWGGGGGGKGRWGTRTWGSPWLGAFSCFVVFLFSCFHIFGPRTRGSHWLVASFMFIVCLVVFLFSYCLNGWGLGPGGLPGLGTFVLFVVFHSSSYVFWLSGLGSLPGVGHFHVFVVFLCFMFSYFLGPRAWGSLWPGAFLCFCCVSLFLMFFIFFVPRTWGSLWPVAIFIVFSCVSLCSHVFHISWASDLGVSLARGKKLMLFVVFLCFSYFLRLGPGGLPGLGHLPCLLFCVLFSCFHILGASLRREESTPTPVPRLP